MVTHKYLKIFGKFFYKYFFPQYLDNLRFQTTLRAMELFYFSKVVGEIFQNNLYTEHLQTTAPVITLRKWEW